MPGCHEQDLDQLREHLRSYVKNFFDLEDTSGIEIFSMIQILANLSENLGVQLGDDIELSGPRWRLMLRLLIEEKRGNAQGITPTALSHSQRVSKNTISALLRGLEDQGLIRRNLDAKDFRVFRIQLTDTGREWIIKSAPRRIEGLNRLLADLLPEEREQLAGLLMKLSHSMMAKSREARNAAADH